MCPVPWETHGRWTVDHCMLGCMDCQNHFCVICGRVWVFVDVCGTILSTRRVERRADERCRLHEFASLTGEKSAHLLVFDVGHIVEFEFICCVVAYGTIRSRTSFAFRTQPFASCLNDACGDLYVGLNGGYATAIRMTACVIRSKLATDRAWKTRM